MRPPSLPGHQFFIPLMIIRQVYISSLLCYACSQQMRLPLWEKKLESKVNKLTLLILKFGSRMEFYETKPISDDCQQNIGLCKRFKQDWPYLKAPLISPPYKFIISSPSK